MPICGQCGVIAPRLCQACASCSANFAAPPLSAPRMDAGGYWVAVRCSFQCRSCGFAAPLDQLDIDGAVECAYCGLRQRFEPSTWTEALSFAHAVGDLAGPEAEGRHADPSVWIGHSNPFRDVGETLAFSEFRESGMEMSDGMMIPKSLHIRAAPGFPVCLRCRRPFSVQVTPDGRTITSCASCGENGTYALPERARAYGAALLGVVAPEHRVDKVRATEMLKEQGGVAGITCPTCGAPLALRGGERTIRCQFCSAYCRVPGSFLVRAGHDKIEPEIWWMRFGGPSAKRRELETGSGIDPIAIEVPPLSGGLSYKQLAVTTGFLVVALWLGFELASIDAISDLAPPDSLPTRNATVKQKAR